MQKSTMTANEVLDAVHNKYAQKGVLVRELVLDVEPYSDPVENLHLLQTYRNLFKEDNIYYQELVEAIGDNPVADCLPDKWKAQPRNRRIDGLLSHSKKMIAIEVKVTVADFKRETEEKRRPWEKVTHQFVYATPKGLLDPKEIPSHCGLWEVDEIGRVNIVKKAKINKNPEPIPQQIVVALMYRSLKRKR